MYFPFTFLSPRSLHPWKNKSVNYTTHCPPLHYPILPPYPHALESWAPAYRLQPCRQGMQRLAAVTERQVNYITGHPLYLVASTGFIFSACVDSQVIARSKVAAEGYGELCKRLNDWPKLLCALSKTRSVDQSSNLTLRYSC